MADCLSGYGRTDGIPSHSVAYHGRARDAGPCDSGPDRVPCDTGAASARCHVFPGNHGAKCITDSVAFCVADGFSSHCVSGYGHPDDSFARDGVPCDAGPGDCGSDFVARNRGALGIPGDAGPGDCGSDLVACDGCSNNLIYSFSDAVQRDMLAARRDAPRAQGGTSIDQRNRWRVRADEPRPDGRD